LLYDALNELMQTAVYKQWEWQFTGVWTAAHRRTCVPAAGVDTRQHLRSANRQLLAVPSYRLNTLHVSDVIPTGLASLLVNKPICLPDIYASLPVRSFDLHAVT